MYAGVVNNLASLYRTQNKLDEAASLYRESLAIIGRHIESTALALTEQQQLSLGRTARFYLDSYLSCVLQRGALQVDVTAAYRVVLAWKG